GAVGSTVINVNLNDTETLNGATTGFGGTTGTTGASSAGTLTIQAADINSGTAVTINVATTDVASTVAANINTAVGYTLATVSSGELKLQDPSGSKITVVAAPALPLASVSAPPHRRHPQVPWRPLTSSCRSSTPRPA